MIATHLGKTPRIDPLAVIAPNAPICGDVTVGLGMHILFGAQIVAEGGKIASALAAALGAHGDDTVVDGPGAPRTRTPGE